MFAASLLGICENVVNVDGVPIPRDPRVTLLAAAVNGCGRPAVRVWEIPLQPGERIGFHRDVLAYFWTAVTPGRARSYNLAGPSVETVYAAGETKHRVYGPGEYKVHDVENIASTELVFTTVGFLQSTNAALSLPNGEPASVPR